MERIKNLQSQINAHPLKYFGVFSLLSPEHQAILERIEVFCNQYLNTQKYLQFFERSEFPNYIMPELEKLNIGRHLLPPPQGISTPVAVQGLTIAALAAHDVSLSTFYFIQLLTAKFVIDYGTKEEKQKYIEDMIALKKLCGFCLTQREIGSNTNNLSTSFKKEGDKYILNGNKRWISNGNRELMIVMGQLVGQKRIVAALIQSNKKGISYAKIENKYNFRLAQNCQIYYKDVEMEQKQFLLGASSFKDGVEPTLKFSRIIVIWNSVGASIGAYRQALRVAKNRKKVSLFDQERLGKMMGEIQGMLLSSWRISELFDKGNLPTQIVGLFKAHVTARARQVAKYAREIMGEQNDPWLMKHWLMKQVLDIYEGTYDINSLLGASHLTGLRAFI